MKRILIRLSGGLLVLAILGVVAGLIWSNTELEVDTEDADPAIAHLNSLAPGGSQFREGYFEHEGNRLHYVEAGKGEVIVFLHGFPSYWLSLSNQMMALKDDYRVVAIDGLGAGRSDAPLYVEQYGLERMSAHVIALVDQLGAEKIHLVGHDWGSTFAFGIAQRHPDRVLSVTGISAPPQNVLLASLETDPAARDAAAYVEQLKSANPLLIIATGGHKRVWTGAYEPLVNAGHMTPEIGQLMRDATGNPRRLNAHINWYRANIPAVDALNEDDYWPSRNARLTMPAQMIWGMDDPILVASYDERLAELADDLSTLRLPDTGHWPHVERSAEVNDAVRALIEEADKTAEIATVD